jgi:hypothetical protein
LADAVIPYQTTQLAERGVWRRSARTPWREAMAPWSQPCPRRSRGSTCSRLRGE